MRVNICPFTMLSQLNVSAQSKDPHLLSGFLSQSHTGLFQCWKWLPIKCSESSAWRILCEKHCWDRLTFKKLNRFPPEKEIVRPGFTPGQNRTEQDWKTCSVTVIPYHWQSRDSRGPYNQEETLHPSTDDFLSTFRSLGHSWGPASQILLKMRLLLVVL